MSQSCSAYLHMAPRLTHNAQLPVLLRAGAAAQFFCEPKGGNADEEALDECVFRDDTLVLLELTTRDMMEVAP